MGITYLGSHRILKNPRVEERRGLCPLRRASPLSLAAEGAAEASRGAGRAAPGFSPGGGRPRALCAARRPFIVVTPQEMRWPWHWALGPSGRRRRGRGGDAEAPPWLLGRPSGSQTPPGVCARRPEAGPWRPACLVTENPQPTRLRRPILGEGWGSWRNGPTGRPRWTASAWPPPGHNKRNSS